MTNGELSYEYISAIVFFNSITITSLQPRIKDTSNYTFVIIHQLFITQIWFCKG